MRNLFYLLFLTFFISCNSNKKEVDEVSEPEAYLLLNEYVANDIAKAQEQIILYESQLLKPDLTEADLEGIIQRIKNPEEKTANEELQYIEGINFEPPALDLRRFSKDNWNQNQLSNFQVFGKEFFNNDIISKEEYLFEKFKTSRVHTISYPIYFPKYKLAVVYDKPYSVGGLNCIQQTNYYFYLKKENG